MSSSQDSPKPSRQELLAAVALASRESSTTAVFFHTAFAAQVGLGATDTKTLLILGTHGSLTAGELATHTGLTSASVTNLIDRLESKGFVHRVRDSKDRRRVIVEPNADRFAELSQLFDSWLVAFADLLDSYSDDQLATIADFLTRAAQQSREAIAAHTGQESGNS